MNDAGLNERNGSSRMDANQVSTRVNPDPGRLKNWLISVKPTRGSAAAKRKHISVIAGCHLRLLLSVPRRVEAVSRLRSPPNLTSRGIACQFADITRITPRMQSRPPIMEKVMVANDLESAGYFNRILFA
jgi:hypothetical protein